MTNETLLIITVVALIILIIIGFSAFAELAKGGVLIAKDNIQLRTELQEYKSLFNASQNIVKRYEEETKIPLEAIINMLQDDINGM